MNISELFKPEEVKYFFDRLSNLGRSVTDYYPRQECQRQVFVRRVLKKRFVGKYFLWIENKDTGFSRYDTGSITHKQKSYIKITKLDFGLGHNDYIAVSYNNASTPYAFLNYFKIYYNEAINLEAVEISKDKYDEIYNLFDYKEPIKTFTFTAFDTSNIGGEKFKEITIEIDAPNLDSAIDIANNYHDKNVMIATNKYTKKLKQ